jgi:hypothetical protein
VGKCLSRHAFAHAVKDHGADQRRSALEHGHNKVANAGIGGVVGRDFFAPNLAQLAALFREANYEN